MYNMYNIYIYKLYAVYIHNYTHNMYIYIRVQNTTWSDSENNSKYALQLQKPMHLKSEKKLKIGFANMICPNDIL